MKTNYWTGVVLMDHDEESAVTNQGSIYWKNGKLEAQYETTWRYRWTINQIQQQMYDAVRLNLQEWTYFQFLLKVLTFKIPHIIFTWEKGKVYK